jgi:putative cardiolipin synthase
LPILRICAAVTVVAAVAAERPGWAASVRLLDDGVAALQTRIELISGACSSIDIAVHWLDDDEVVQLVVSHLAAAARRDVVVRLIGDAHHNRLSAGMVGELRAAGARVREYRPLRFEEPLGYHHRMHDKLLIVDGRSLIVGGRNLAAAYFELADQRNRIDRDVLIDCQAAAWSAQQYFERLWHDPRTNEVEGAFCRTLSLARLLMLTEGLEDDVDWCRPSSGCAWPALELAPTEMRFVTSHRRGPENPHGISSELLSLVENAGRRIVIETPYLLVPPRFERALADACRRGVSVSIITNSLATTDHVISYSAYLNQQRRLLCAGIELWEYRGPDLLHAKGFVIDDVVVIGSYNLNRRSLEMDTEVGVLVTNGQLAEMLLASIAAHRADSDRVCACSRNACLNRSHRRAGCCRIVRLHMLRLIAPLVERYL